MYEQDEEELWLRMRVNNSNLVNGVHALRHVKNYTLPNAKCITNDALAILGVGRYDKGLFANMTMQDVCIAIDV